jgi:hypothetical protein
MMGYAILIDCLNNNKGNYSNTIFIRDYRWSSVFIISIENYFRVAPHWLLSNKYTPSRSQGLMHVLALELLRLSK